MRARSRSARCRTLPVLLALLLPSCRPAPPPQEPTPPASAPSVGELSPERAWEHLRALTAIGPRAAGTEGGARARAYIQEQLTALGLEVETMELSVDFDDADVPTLELVNLTALVPGEFEDEVVLVAPYDTAHFDDVTFVGANEGGSGAALLLELARVIRDRPLPYTTRLAFLDGEARLGRGGADDENVRFIGSSSLARSFAADGILDRIRLLVVLDRVGDTDLHIARDLRSHRIYREEFWRAASKLGRSSAFPPHAAFESVIASHIPFVDAGLKRTVVLSDTVYGGVEPPGTLARTEDDTLEHCSPESLAVVGAVTLEALDRITKRLAKIDRFARAPVTADVEPEPEPEAPAASSPGSEPASGEPAGSGTAAAQEEAPSADPPQPPGTSAPAAGAAGSEPADPWLVPSQTPEPSP